MTDSSFSRCSVSSPSTSRAPQAFYNIADEFVSRLAREYPEKLAILGTGRAQTYVELEALVERVAAALRSANCQPGERVLIALPDSAELIAAFFGAAKIGAIAVPVNPMARAADYRHWLENCGARIAIVHAPILGEFGDGVAGDAVLDLLVICESTAGTVKPERAARRILEWDDWVPSRVGSVATHPTVATDPAFFLYTSGSGGAPKAVVHRHQDMSVAARNYAQGVLGLRADDRLFSASKLFFAYGLGNGMYFPLHFGAGTILYPERPRADDIAAVIAEHRPTVFFSVPTFYASLLREAEKGLMLDFSSVRLAVSAGESLPAEIFEQFRQRFGIEILDGIGSSEMLHIFLSSRPGEARAASCGREVPGYEARILDDGGEPAAVDEAGNVGEGGECVRGVLAHSGAYSAHEARRLGQYWRQVFARRGRLFLLSRAHGRHDEGVGNVGFARRSGECVAGAFGDCGVRGSGERGRGGVGAAGGVHCVAAERDEYGGGTRQRDLWLVAHAVAGI